MRLGVTVRSCRYGAVLRACQMAIDADLNGVIANVGNGVGHWKRMATRLARTLAEPQARSGTGRTERRATATSGPKYRHDRTVTPRNTRDQIPRRKPLAVTSRERHLSWRKMMARLIADGRRRRRVRSGFEKKGVGVVYSYYSFFSRSNRIPAKSNRPGSGPAPPSKPSWS